MRKEIVYIRVVATLMVVFYHCLCFYTPIWPLTNVRVNEYYVLADFLNSIDMPAFVFISGYLYSYLKLEKGKYQDNKAFVVNKVKRLLIPYLLLAGLLVLLGEITRPIRILYGTSHLWFLLMLFEVFVFMQLTQRFWQRLSFPASLTLCVVTYVVCPYLPGLLPDAMYHYVDKFLNFLPKFYVGMFCHQHLLPIMRQKNWSNTVWLSSLLLVLLLVAVVSYFSTMDPFPCSRNLRWVFAIIFLILALGWMDSRSDSIHISGWMSSFDRNSLGIYLIHHILLWETWRHNAAFRTFITEDVLIAPLVVFVIVLALSWALAALINRSPLRFIIGS